MAHYLLVLATERESEKWRENSSCALSPSLCVSSVGTEKIFIKGLIVIDFFSFSSLLSFLHLSPTPLLLPLPLVFSLVPGSLVFQGLWVQLAPMTGTHFFFSWDGDGINCSILLLIGYFSLPSLSGLVKFRHEERWLATVGVRISG